MALTREKEFYALSNLCISNLLT